MVFGCVFHAERRTHPNLLPHISTFPTAKGDVQQAYVPHREMKEGGRQEVGRDGRAQEDKLACAAMYWNQAQDQARRRAACAGVRVWMGVNVGVGVATGGGR